MTHGGAVIIATDGACRNNGRSNAASGCGVFFGMYSAHNIAFQPEDARPTNQRAELQTAISALSKVRHMAANGELKNEGWINEIIIKTDSAFVVNSMTDWILKWRDNGHLSGKGVPVVNQELIQRLDFLCNQINDLNFRARFWNVRRENNMQADRLANAALDGADWRNFSEEEWFKDTQKPVIHSYQDRF
jgi:ribonuclease HI